MAQAELIDRYDSAAPDWAGKLSRLGYEAAYLDFIRHVAFERKPDCAFAISEPEAALLQKPFWPNAVG